jgi:hypothetical protein
MGRRRVEGRAAKAVIAVIILAMTLIIARMIPGVMPAIGFPGGYKFSTLRSGSMYTEARPGAWIWGSPRRKSSILIASAGDEIVIRSTARIDRGRVIINVAKGAWGTDFVYSVHVKGSGEQSVRVPVPEGGIYRVSANYVLVFRGRHDLDWYVD